MVNEAIITTLLGNQGDPVEFLIDAGSNIAKGSLMILTSSPMTIQAHDGTIGAGSQIFAGIAAIGHESGANAGTKLSVITNCIAEITAGSTSADAFVLGEPIVTSASNNNTCGPASDDTVNFRSRVVGVSQETVTAGNIGAVKITAMS